MLHVDFERLWAFAHDELGAAEQDEARAHLSQCDQCAGTLASIQAARPLMRAPPVPQLSDERWKAIDNAVFEAAARELMRPSLWRRLQAFWDAPLFKPALALVAMAASVVLFVLYLRTGTAPRPSDDGTGPVAVVVPTLVTPAPAAPSEALVVAAVEAQAASVAAQPAQRLVRGAKVSTRKRGEAWLELPDGSRLGVLADSLATLQELSAQAVKVDLGQGAVAIAAQHEPLQRLEVVAGRLSVISVGAVGSRFMVMRDADSSEVAVEEGSVEVEYDGKTELVPAGRSLTLSNRGSELAKIDEPDASELREIIPPKPPAAHKKPHPVTPAPTPGPAAPEGPVFAVETPPVPERPIEDEWAHPATQAAASAVTSAQPQPVDPPAFMAVTPEPPRRELLKKNLDKNLGPIEQLAAQIKGMVRDGHCDRVIAKADELIEKGASNAKLSPRRQAALRKILEERARCLELRGLGRIPP